ncbi:MAG: DUF1553 domain-containing protein [Planctomycetota bacterium]|jgi:mono/diheme cytochrome c family protein
MIRSIPERYAVRLLPVWLVGLLSGSAVQAAEASLTFEADVRPILKAHCFQCHGEAGEKEGGLDLRLQRLMIAGGDSGSAIEPGRANDSLLLERVTSGEMPPGDKRLSKEEISRIAAWIASGAKTARPEPETLGDGPLFTEEERHWWAFQPVNRPGVPTHNDESVSTSVDAFVLTRLRQQFVDQLENAEALSLSQAASRETLIRRASFDLLGLPPTPEQIGEFLADETPYAWPRLIDRLLASPHYGERWGRHWLDVAGYADSEGYTDEDRVREHAFRFRDYVVRAFNDDKPFNQFIIEQLAGDELAGPTGELTPQRIELLTATGFLRMAPDGTASSGIDQDVARNQVVADTLQIVGGSLLGMTLHCAQCHDHRYDPISQADYYRVRAIFEPSLDWKKWKTPPARQISLYTDTDRELRSQIEAKAKLVDDERQERVDYYITKTLEQELLLIDDELQDPLRTAYRTEAAKRTDEQKQLLEKHTTIGRLTPGALYLYDRRRDARAKDIETKRAEKEAAFIAAAKERELAKLPENVQVALRIALAATEEVRSETQQKLLEEHANVVITADTLAAVDPEAAKKLDVYTQAAAEIRKDRIRTELQEYSDKAAEIRKEIPKETFIRALLETPGSQPDTFFFFRGDHDQPKQKLEPAGLSVLDLGETIPANDDSVPTSGRRLAYARYLTSGRHPLVARAIVNRIWLHHFGRGLVNSPSDFGVLGERPTHPELLDWLASEFVDSGWSVKHLHRLVMTSSVYQQSSQSSAELAELDPENRYYGRCTMRRLESEVVRDAVLAVSGKLNQKLFGDPVPVMEDAVGQIVLGKENLDGERKPTKPIPLNGEEFRRSVYVQVRRSRPLGVLETFDSPSMSPNCERRVSSNVAPQALLMMNSDFAVEYSDQFATRLSAEAGEGIRDQIALGWQLAFGTTPSVEDVSAAEQYIEQQRQTIQAAATEAKPA